MKKQLIYLFLLGICLMTFSCIRIHNTIPTVPTNDKKDYSQLSYQITNDYRYITETLRFVYDEKYNDNALKYKIYANDGSIVFSNTDQVFPIRYGRNHIELKLPKSTFAHWGLLSPLLLEVTNAKNQKQYLKFNYSI